jgi:hypothetical protein
MLVFSSLRCVNTRSDTAYCRRYPSRIKRSHCDMWSSYQLDGETEMRFYRKLGNRDVAYILTPFDPQIASNGSSGWRNSNA